jgi:hypothetical protein
MEDNKMEVSNNMLAALVVFAMAATLGGTITIISNIPGQPFPLTGFTSEYEQGIANATLATEANIILLVDLVEFGGIAATPGVSNDTVDFSPHPFVVQNNGTARLNVSVGESNSDTLWVQNDTSYCFQFNASTNGSTFVTQYMSTSWADFAGGAQVASASDLDSEASPNLVWNLSTTGGYDRFNVNLRIVVPMSEEGGAKEATIFFEGTAAA